MNMFRSFQRRFEMCRIVLDHSNVFNLGNGPENGGRI